MIPSNIWPSYVLTEPPGLYFRALIGNVSSDPVPNSPENIWISPFALYILTQIISHTPLGKGPKKQPVHCSWCCIIRLCPRAEDWLISRSKGWWSYWDDYPPVIYTSPPIIHLHFLLLIQSMSYPDQHPIHFLLGTPCSMNCSHNSPWIRLPWLSLWPH